MASYAAEQAARMRPRQWTLALLERCSAGELAALCELLGVAKAGNKAEKIARLLDLGNLRETLSAFEGPDAPDALVARFSRKELYAMAKRAKCYLGGPKRLLACSLLNWRNECRRRGQLALKEAGVAAQTEVRQLRLKLVFPA